MSPLPSSCSTTFSLLGLPFRVPVCAFSFSFNAALASIVCALAITELARLRTALSCRQSSCHISHRTHKLATHAERITRVQTRSTTRGERESPERLQINFLSLFLSRWPTLSARPAYSRFVLRPRAPCGQTLGPFAWAHKLDPPSCRRACVSFSSSSSSKSTCTFAYSGELYALMYYVWSF